MMRSLHTPAARGRHSTRLLVVGVLLACIGALGSAFAWSAVRDDKPVVVMVNDVRRGERIEAGDVAVARVSLDTNVSALPAQDAETLVGRYARYDLEAGSLPGTDAAGDDVLAAGKGRLGLRLAAGRVPAQPLPAGTAVVLVRVDDPESSPVRAKTVGERTELPGEHSYLVDVEINEVDVVAVASAAATDSLVLVREADSPW